VLDCLLEIIGVVVEYVDNTVFGYVNGYVDGLTVGTVVINGWLLTVGINVGDIVGIVDGTLVGELDVGETVGKNTVGLLVGDEVAYLLGVVVGAEVGLDVERDVGEAVGENVVGLLVGDEVEFLVGVVAGAEVGLNVGPLDTICVPNKSGKSDSISNGRLNRTKSSSVPLYAIQSGYSSSKAVPLEYPKPPMLI